ncbi:nocobactin polyketide synthase NbtC [Nocardia aurantiaca]|uniref:Nocobactin polyketide synthase NbtC n=1 Tax=Nocardia aurantiaca TaxID=2675850 RepID=A0A6I3KQT6_9NOCA|nr:nocobactin polyketide synthase NbtC [Nocardia aurantiaca]MTE11486.1 nocobactin polyketide synthase NbtC [Nocardia aurantiaca]
MCSHRLPDGSVPVLLSSDTADGVRAEAAALAAYLEQRPAITPDRLADMLFRTRTARRYRSLAMVTERAELLDALRAIIDGDSHPAVVTGDGPATARRIGFVFPGQGGQRPGMGKLYYDLSPAYRAAVDECAAVHAERFGHDQPLHYLLGAAGSYQDTVWEVQPALMFHMTGLAAMWQAAGVRPAATIGHSQGELAAGAVSRVMSVRDAVLVVTHRARLVERISPRGYSMAVLAMDREDCEALLARHSGWAELSVVNAPHIMAISGDRETIVDMVAAAAERGHFAREIGVAYPAHTSIVAEVRADFEGFLGDEMRSPTFFDVEIPCYGATLGTRITPDLVHERYWYWNLRNRVRFDLAVVAAASDGIDTLIEIVEHPVLQLALQENLTLVPPDPARGARDFKVLGTSLRTATSLREFTRNVAAVAVHDLGYSWDALRTAAAPALPLRDFPHTVLNPRRLWADPGYAPEAVHPPVPAVPKPQRLVEKWTPWQCRTLTPPRRLAFIDPSGRCADQLSALLTAADRYGATATALEPDVIAGTAAVAADTTAAIGVSEATARGPESVWRGDAAGSPSADFDSVVILWPALPESAGAEAVAELAEFFGGRAWLPAVSGVRAGGEVWLVTVSGEAVVPGDAAPQLFHGAVASGFRCVGAEMPGAVFRHLDLAADAGAGEANRVVTALHTVGEPEVALRGGKVFVKRLVCDESAPGAAADLDHVLIVGGTGKLGLLFAAHFARQGAGRVTLVSRSGESGSAAMEVARLRAAGSTEIVVAACDVSDAHAVARLGAGLEERPVSLLVHAAVTYVDAGIADITADMVTTAAASKVLGLEAVLGAAPLCPEGRVLLCSSMAATLGGRGQILYAVTNRMLDILARRLRERGIDCNALEWGLWSVAGPLDAAGMARVEGAGVYPMHPADAIAAGFTGQPTDAIVISADWPLLRDVMGAFGQAAVLSDVREPEPIPSREPGSASGALAQPRADEVVAEMDSAAPPVTQPMAPATGGPLADQVLAELERVMGIDTGDSIDRSAPLVALGLDSLQALDFRKRVQGSLHRDLPVAAILGGASLDDIVLLMAENTN